MPLATTEEIIAELKAGRMVVLVDEEDRENEGDLVMAAEFATPEAINFMAKYGRGLICLTLTQARCKQLNLPLMTYRNGTQYGTAFTLSIEAAEGSPRASPRPIAPTRSKPPSRATPARKTSSSRGTCSRSWRSPAVCWCAQVIPKPVATSRRWPA